MDLAAGVVAAPREDRSGPSRSREELLDAFREPLPRAGVGAERLLRRLRDEVVPATRRLSHPRTMGHQVCPPLPVAVAVDGLVTALNQSLAVHEMSPALSAVEHAVLRWFAGRLAWSWDDADGAGGTFVSGGTEGNLTALLAARARAFPDAFRRGLPREGAGPCVVAPEASHYCIERAAGVMGLGMDAVVRVPCEEGRMRIDSLRCALQGARDAGRPVLAVVAAAGSTTTGAVDRLAAVADLAREFSVWFHVDAAHGGALLLSDRLRPLLAGMERADSVAIDLHKMMFQPLSTALVLVRRRGDLDRALEQSAPYLFHGDDGDGPVRDLGRHALQCSRRGDALRAWATLVALGADGVAALQERTVDLAARAAALLEERPGWESCHHPEMNVLCFRRVPPRLGGDVAALDALQRRLRARVNADGAAFISGSVLDGRAVLRCSFMNPRATPDDFAAVLDLLEAAGEEGEELPK